MDRQAGTQGCWEWQGAVDSKGYGGFWAEGRAQGAHRIAYELSTGRRIPAGEGHHGICILHTCDNRRCCNPAHLFVGTQADNMRDMARKGRSGAKPMRGSRNGQSKLTAADVATIRRWLPAGWLQSDVAAAFGVSQSCISQALSGATWT